MAQTEEHTVRGLTGSPRAEEGGGDSRAAPGYGQAVPLRSPSGSEVEGEWETGAETRDDPATAAPPPSHSASASPPRLIPPLSVDALPRPRPQVASGSAPGRPLPAVALRPRLPAPYPRARAPAPRARLPPAFTGARACASRFAAPPALPRVPRAFGLLRSGPAFLDTSLYRREKRWDPSFPGMIENYDRRLSIYFQFLNSFFPQCVL